MKLDQLAGNGPLKRQLSAQASGRGLSHAYLISGPAGSGKSTLARLLAAAMVCTGEGETPCGLCSGCKKALAGIHPDIITVAGEDGKALRVDQVRAARSDAYIRPNEAPRKVYIFPDAQDLSPACQNAMLKLLEEGPAYAAFLLLTDNPGALLPTIRSRCEGAALTPVTRQEAEDWLFRRYPDREPEEVRRAAAACGGILGRAVTALEGESGEEIPAAAEKLLELLTAGDELELATYCISLEKWGRGDLAGLMEREIGLLRDVLACQTGAKEGTPALRKAAALPRKRLLDWAERLEELRSAVDFNVGAGHLCGALCAGLSS